jgi:hypothetical protein
MITRLVCAFLLATIAVACGEFSPASPSVAKVEGVWRGTSTLQTASPTGNCVADILRATVGTADGTQAFTWAITQNGTSLAITETISGTTRTYTGTVGESALSATAGRGTVVGATGVACPDRIPRTFVASSSAVTAVVSGNQITGGSTVVYDVSVAATGVAAGVVTTTATFVLTRQ